MTLDTELPYRSHLNAAQRRWVFGYRSSSYFPTVEDMARHFDNYSDLLEGVRRYGCLMTYDLALDSSDDSYEAFFRRCHGGVRIRAEDDEEHENRQTREQRRWEAVQRRRCERQQAASEKQWQAEADRRWLDSLHKDNPPPPPEPEIVLDADDELWIEQIAAAVVAQWGWSELRARVRARAEVVAKLKELRR